MLYEHVTCIDYVQMQFCEKHTAETGKPVNVLCQADICNTCSIIRQEVYVWFQDECVHCSLVVL